MIPWPFSAITRTRAPLRDIPKNLSGVTVLGMMSGPFFALIFGTLEGEKVWPALVAAPLNVILPTMTAGGIFAFSFYTCCAIPQNLLSQLGEGHPLAHNRAIRVAIGAVGAALGYLVSAALMRAILGIRLPGHDRIIAILILEALMGAGIAFAIGSFIHLRRQMEHAKALLLEKQLREKEMAAAAAKAQAFALQAQIQPHFFFNTLNTVSALMYQQPDSAHEVIGRLAELFRYTLASSTTEMMPLEQELAFVENYLRIEQARFGERLRFSLPSPDEIPDVCVPGLTLQPIVENSIRYGISRRLDGGLIEVLTMRNGSSFSIVVRNPFERSDGAPDLSEQRIFQNGHAMWNVRERLQLFFGERATIELRQDGDECVTAEIRVPHD